MQMHTKSQSIGAYLSGKDLLPYISWVEEAPLKQIHIYKRGTKPGAGEPVIKISNAELEEHTTKGDMLPYIKGLVEAL